jgi:thiamine biosynthesis lipoprotein
MSLRQLYPPLVFLALTFVGTKLYYHYNPTPAAPPRTESTPASTASTQSTQSNEVAVQHARFPAMGSRIDLSIVTADQEAAKTAFTQCQQEIKRLEGLWSTWIPSSEVSQINAAAGKQPVSVSPETFKILQRSLAASQQTQGLFDITVGAFSGVWKFDQDRDGTLPDTVLVQERLDLVSYQDLVLDPVQRTAFLKRPNMKINLGGIGKGAVVDHCSNLFQQQGFSDFLVQAGGDLYVSGKKGQTPWKVGVRDPRGAEDQTIASFSLQNRSCSTSGDYERFVIRDGKRYHHILDPRTGYPATQSMSVTVSARDAITAEGLSKAFFILGPTETQKRLEAGEFPDIGVLIIGTDGSRYLSPSMRSGPLATLLWIAP